MPDICAEYCLAQVGALYKIQSNHEGPEDERESDDDHEVHLILLSLLNALLPNIVLQWCLL